MIESLKWLAIFDSGVVFGFLLACLFISSRHQDEKKDSGD